MGLPYKAILTTREEELLRRLEKTRTHPCRSCSIPRSPHCWNRWQDILCWSSSFCLPAEINQAMKWRWLSETIKEQSRCHRSDAVCLPARRTGMDMLQYYTL